MLRLFFRSGYQELQQVLNVGDRLRIVRGEAGTLRTGEQSSDGTHVVEAGLRTISQSHATLSRQPDGRVLAEDCGSTNGTYLRLIPNQPVEVPENAELLLGQELTLTLNNPRWGSDQLREAIALQRPADLLLFLKERLKDLVSSVRLVSPEETGTAPRSSQDELRLPLIDRDQLVVKWQFKTSNAEADRWLRAVVSLYNSQRDATARAWEFTAVSPQRQQALWMAKRVAASNFTVLLYGASGSGKEVLASDLHNNSPRAGHPFVVVNCGAVHAEQADRVVLGQSKGASSSAQEAFAMLLEQADGGTLFLDEIDKMPLDLQVRLLRVLEAPKVKSPGGKTESAIDIRVIATTQRSLETMVSDKTLRQDLYYHLSKYQIFIPPIEVPDIAALAQLFLNSLSQVRGTPPSETELHVLAEHAASRSWPGGVRELRNAMERYMLLCDPKRSVAENWNMALAASGPLPAPASAPPGRGASQSPVSNPPRSEVAVPERAPMSVSKQVDTLLFLSVLQQALECDPRVGISVIARRVNLTYQGVLNRLKKLELRLDGQDALPRIRARIHAERERLAPVLPWVHHAIAD